MKAALQTLLCATQQQHRYSVYTHPGWPEKMVTDPVEWYARYV